MKDLMTLSNYFIVTLYMLILCREDLKQTSLRFNRGDIQFKTLVRKTRPKAVPKNA